jgi:hypothetical protein
MLKALAAQPATTGAAVVGAGDVFDAETLGLVLRLGVPLGLRRSLVEADGTVGESLKPAALELAGAGAVTVGESAFVQPLTASAVSKTSTPTTRISSPSNRSSTACHIERWTGPTR